MMSTGILVALFFKMACVEDISLPSKHYTTTTERNPENYDEVHGYGRNYLLGSQDRCVVMVISNQRFSNSHQSLLRKYRYNIQGQLIPGSVQYFIKFPQDKHQTVLVPLKDKSFSPSGGFVRYYKEVPPIPQYWKR